MVSTKHFQMVVAGIASKWAWGFPGLILFFHTLFFFFAFKKEGKSNTDCKAREGHEITGVPLFLVNVSLSLGFIATPLCMISQSSAENSRLGLKAEQESGNNIKQPLNCKKAFCSQLGCDHVGLLSNQCATRVELFPLIANALWGACRGSGIWVTSSKLCVHFCSSLKINFTTQALYFTAQQWSFWLFCFGWFSELPACGIHMQSRGYMANSGRCGVPNQITRTKCLWDTSVFDWDWDSIWTCPSDQLISYSSHGIHWGQNKHHLCWKLCPNSRTSVKHCTRDNLNIPMSWQITASKLLFKSLKCSNVVFEVLNIYSAWKIKTFTLI